MYGDTSAEVLLSCLGKAMQEQIPARLTLTNGTFTGTVIRCDRELVELQSGHERTTIRLAAILAVTVG